MGSIYKITNKLDGKIYIGLTTRDPERRFYEHIYLAEHKNENTISTVISEAIASHGKNNFTFEVIEENIDNEKLDDLEKKYIAEYNCLVPNGYNVSFGGRAAAGDLGKGNRKGVYQLDAITYDILSYEKSISEMSRKLNVTPISISDICNRKNNHFTSGGYTFAFEDTFNKAEVEEYMKTKRGAIVANGIEMFFLDNDEIIDNFMTSSAAAKELHIEVSNILQYLSGERKIAGTYKGRSVGARQSHNDEANAIAELKRQKIIITKSKAEELKLNENPDIYWNYKLLYDVLMNKNTERF